MSALDPLGWGLIALAAPWFLASLMLLLDLRHVGPLPPGTDAESPATAGSITVVIAARDEQVRIGTAVRRLLDQREVDLRVVVVDDRSSDDTAQIVSELAAKDPRVRLVRVEQLPHGWIGKPHACHVGAAGAQTDWLLFTDADSWIGPDVLARCLDAARDERADHVTLFPGEDDVSWSGRPALLCFGMGMLHQASRANRDRPRSLIGVGAFNLVRAAAYRSIGGHRTLRFEVVDDMILGQWLRRAGFRSRVYAAPDDVTVSWAASATGMIRALQKNSFAVAGYSVGRTVAAVIVSGFATMAPLLAPWTGHPLGWLPLVALFSLSVPATLLSLHMGWGIAPGLLTPLVQIVLPATIANSMLSVLRRGGLEWRGTFYPLDELRRGHTPMSIF